MSNETLMVQLRSLIPTDWSQHLRGGIVCLGLDVASTTNALSNPSSLTVLEEWEGLYYERLILRWKTGDYDVMLGIITLILESIPYSCRKTLVVDKSNEKFAANKLQKDLEGEIEVIGFAGQNKVTYEGEESDAKTAMGSAYTNALEDGLIAMPSGKWIRDDHRLVTRNGSKFECKPDKDGNHADTFDSGKLAYWGFLGVVILDCDPVPGEPPSNNDITAYDSEDHEDPLIARNNQGIAQRPF